MRLAAGACSGSPGTAGATCWTHAHNPLFAGALDTTLDAAREARLDLPPRARPPVPSRDEFIAAFEQLGGSVGALARHFARDRRQIYCWIDAHGMADRR